MKRLLLSGAFFLTSISFGQTHTYIFKLQGVTNYSQAKLAILEMRDILHIKVFYFNDNTDEFKTHTDLVYNWLDMTEDLNLNNYFIDGEIIHLFSE